MASNEPLSKEENFHHSKITLSVFVCCIGLLLSACARKPSDADLVSAIQAKLLQDPSLNSYYVRVDSQNGAVTVTGVVGSDDAKTAVENLVKSSAGVKSISNDLTVYSISPSKVDDAAIENAVRTRFSSDPLLSRQSIEEASNNGVVTLSGFVDTQAAASQAEQLAKQTTGVQSVLNQLKVQTGPVAPTISLKATPATITNGQSATLSWSSHSATTLDLEPGIGNVKSHGTQTVSPQNTTDYTLIATGPAGKTSATARVNVWAPFPSPVVNLSVAAPTIRRGQSTTLAWNSQNATSLDLEPGLGKVQPSGSTTVAPQQSTDYTLTATGPGGTTSTTARVTVSQATGFTVPVGTTVTLALVDGIDTSSKDTHAGQKLLATTFAPIVANGQELIPAGSPARVLLTDVKKAGHIKGQSEVRLKLVALTIGGKEYAADSNDYVKQGTPRQFGIPVPDTNSLQVKLPPGSTINFRLSTSLVVGVSP